jgi:pimeloyl-ACP methyl ester carboxylesterase
MFVVRIGKKKATDRPKSIRVCDPGVINCGFMRVKVGTPIAVLPGGKLNSGRKIHGEKGMKTIRVRDLEMSFVEEGSGMPLLLVHGFPLDHSMWKYQIPEFAQHCRVIAPDLRGFGRTTATPGTSTMEQMADDLAALLDALGVQEKIIFCGLSMGGYIAWQFARKYEDRLQALVACDTRAIADSAEQAVSRRELAERVLREGPAPVADSMLPKLFAGETPERRPDLVSATRDLIMRTRPEGIAAALRGLADRPDVTEWLPKLEVATLVIVGEHDAISTPEEMEGIAESLPNSAWVVVPHAGHLCPLENPEVFNQAVAQYITL